jgi:hypothetical protein
VVTLHTIHVRHVPPNRTIPNLKNYAINLPARALKYARLTRLVTGRKGFLEIIEPQHGSYSDWSIVECIYIDPPYNSRNENWVYQ